LALEFQVKLNSHSLASKAISIEPSSQWHER